MKWKKIKDFENYSVSSEGDVRNDKTRRILKKCKNEKGYEYVILSKNGKTKHFKIHRLVAIAFIPNPLGMPCVDHINTVRDDNRVENLMWCTYKQNNSNPLTRKNNSEAHKGENAYWYGKQLSEEHKRKLSESTDKKSVICVTTGEKFESTIEAERKTGVAQPSICDCCNGKRKSAGKDENGNKLVWKYLEDYLTEGTQK